MAAQTKKQTKTTASELISVNICQCITIIDIDYI